MTNAFLSVPRQKAIAAGYPAVDTDDKCKLARCAMLIRPNRRLQYIEFALFCRPDKAFTPHPA
ncbi:hypothetical protein CRI67_17670 [Escherichia sp. E4702]|nr:hypothetical protein CRI67_17670 [Escherichia sp. E4702]